MTEPPTAPAPPPDPTSDPRPDPTSDPTGPPPGPPSPPPGIPPAPPPFSSPQAPPYPPYGTGNPDFRTGTAPVPPPVPPSAYPPPGGGPVPTYAQHPPQRSSRPVIGVVIAVAAVLVLGFCGAGVYVAYSLGERINREVAERTAEPVETPPAVLPGLPTDFPTDLPTGFPSPTTHTIVYEVSGGSGSVDVFYGDANGVKDPGKIKPPWRAEVVVTSTSFPAVVSGMRIDDDPLTCRILVDGREVVKKTSTAFVSCTHMVNG